LATTDDARVHCAVLKIRAVPVSCRLASGGRTVLAEAGREAAVPSGPNSVLGPRPPSGRRPVPRREECSRTLPAGVLADLSEGSDRITSAPLTSSHPTDARREMWLWTRYDRTSPATAPVAP